MTSVGDEFDTGYREEPTVKSVGMTLEDAYDLFTHLPKNDLKFSYNNGRCEVRGSIKTSNPEALEELEAMAQELGKAGIVIMTVFQDRIYNAVTDQFHVRGVDCDFMTQDPELIERLRKTASGEAELEQRKRERQKEHALKIEREQEAKRVREARQEQYAEEALF